MKKDTVVRLRISQEKKELWQEYCDVYGCCLNLSRLIEHAVDDKVCNKTEFRNKLAGEGSYWTVKPTGERRERYDRDVMAKGRAEIERKKERNRERALELGTEEW